MRLISRRKLEEHLDVAFWKGVVAGIGFITAHPEIAEMGEPDPIAEEFVEKMIGPFLATISPDHLTKASLLGVRWGASWRKQHGSSPVQQAAAAAAADLRAAVSDLTTPE